jgi:hypothetical protein
MHFIIPPLGKETIKAMRSGETESSLAFVKVRRETIGRKDKIKTSEQIIFLPIDAIERYNALRREAERLKPLHSIAAHYLDAGFIIAYSEGIMVSADDRAVLDVPILPTDNNHELERERTVRSVQKIAGRKIHVMGKLPTR